VDKLQQSDKFLFRTNEFSLHKTNGLRFTIWTGGAAKFFFLSIFSPVRPLGIIPAASFHRSGGKEAPANLQGPGLPTIRMPIGLG
jgi:hypothetical protein